jgi:hypothetical protein
MAGEMLKIRCPCCGSPLEIRPAGHSATARFQKPMTEDQRRLIEDYCTESHQPFPVGFAGFSVKQASDWIEKNVPLEYIARRRRKLYGYADKGQYQGGRA